MKLRAVVAAGFIAAEVLLSAAFCISVSDIPVDAVGKAFVTQSSALTSSHEYDSVFGDNWESVRTFRLLAPLDKPLKIYVEENPHVPSLYKQQYRQYILESLSNWNNALDGRLPYVMTDRRKDADITVDWVSGFEDRYVAGITTYSVGHASIEIKTVGVPQKDIKCNIMHEFGHALGIAGHSNHGDDIMVGSRRWRRDNSTYNPTLSARDIQAIRRLYSKEWKKGEDLYSANAQSVPVAQLPPVPHSRKENTKVGENSVIVEPPVITWTANKPVAPQNVK